MEVGAGTPGNAQAVCDQLAALITGGTYLDVSNVSQSISYRTSSWHIYLGMSAARMSPQNSCCQCDSNWLPVLCGRVSCRCIGSDTQLLQVALQRAGLGTWSIKLLTISIVQPSQSSNLMPCQKRFGR